MPLTASKIVVRPHRIDTSLFRPATKIKDSILYVGRLSPEKNVMALLYARGALEWGALNIIGDGRCRNDLLVSAELLGISVKWSGFLPQVEVARAMGEAEYFVLPSKYEQASKVLLEAMACGCLVITTPQASRGVIEDGVNGYLCDGSSKGIAEALERARSRKRFLREENR